ncbi:hypothetical protein AVEN_85699-1, partial [Araneus ventricosus]
NEIVSLAKIRGLEVDSYDIDELVEEHNHNIYAFGNIITPRADHRRAFGVALCFTIRSYGGEVVRGG